MPKYKNAPIEEAMCEFTFATEGVAAQWDLTLPGRVQQHHALKDVYNAPSRQQQVQQFVADQTEPNATTNISLSSALLRVLIPTTNNKAVLGIGSNTLSISSLRDYEGWTAFRPRISTALGAYEEVAKPQEITRINLKYINRIIAPKPEAITASEYLDDISPYREAKIETTGELLKASLTAYHYRKEYTSQNNVKIFVTQATLQPADPKNSEFLLDIETVWDRQPITDFVEAMEKVELLHAMEGAIFESFITDAARSLFNGT
ncbi:MAG: TIGR04255 family protein [Anaerolineales bacterium]